MGEPSHRSGVELERCDACRTELEDDKRRGGGRWARRAPGVRLASLLLLPFFYMASSFSFLAAIFWGKTREVLKRALKQIKFGKIEFI
jgi:hypothetical protein